MSDLEFQVKVQAKRVKRMNEIDQFDPATRTLIHAYGFNIVKAFSDLGVKKPSQIKHLVEMVLDEFSPTRGSYSIQGVRTQIDDTRR